MFINTGIGKALLHPEHSVTPPLRLNFHREARMSGCPGKIRTIGQPAVIDRTRDTSPCHLAVLLFRFRTLHVLMSQRNASVSLAHVVHESLRIPGFTRPFTFDWAVGRRRGWLLQLVDIMIGWAACSTAPPSMN